MSDENENAGGQAQEPPPAPTEFQILNGGIEIDAAKIDGSSEKVKVRQLPIGLLGEWGRSQSDEAYLVELLCDRVDRTTVHHITNARMTEMRLHAILQQAPFEQIEAIEKRLSDIRSIIVRYEAKTRWSDTITHESAAEIRELGERLNKKKYADQTKRTTEASKALLEMLTPLPPQISSSP